MKKPSLLAVAAVVVLSGCSARAPEASVRVVPPRVAASPPVAAVLPEPPRAPSYAYAPTGKRDPFLAPEGGPVLPDVMCAEPLCRYRVDELKLAGIISGTSRPVAVLESPRGKGYPVYPGTRVGTRGGVVKQVLRDTLVITESWPGVDGRQHSAEVVLRVSPEAPLALEE